VLTGDTLFIGDVGRPDLVGSKGHTAEEMAGMMFDSLRDKLLPLGDDVEVFPGHGAGSACGRNISSATSCTIGRQRETNHALQAMPREEFVARMTTGLQPPPAYFPHDAELNRRGAEPLDALPELQPLSPEAVERASADGAWILDVRGPVVWSAAHVPGSICLGLDGNLASWAGNLLPVDAAVVLVAETEADAQTARLRLARVGLHGATGWLADGVAGWSASGRETRAQAGRSCAEWQADGRPLIDVRGPGEWEAGHVPGARNAALPRLLDSLGDLDREAPLAVVCQTGYRSAAAASVLRRAGFTDVLDLTGGTAAWIDAGRPVDVPAGVGPA
jgi:hydroxyacylglutathione hydrolase